MIRLVLSDTQIERYSRQILLQTVGGTGQEKLLRARVVVAGRHPAAAVTLRYLVAAGVGRVSATTTEVTALPSNPDVTVRSCPMPASCAEFGPLLAGHDAVVMLGPADAALACAHGICERSGQPLLWGYSAASTAWATLLGRQAAHGCPDCLSAFLAAAQPATSGIAAMAAVTAAWLGTVLATETIKHLLGMPASLSGRVLCADLCSGAIDVVPLPVRCGPCRP